MMTDRTSVVSLLAIGAFSLPALGAIPTITTFDVDASGFQGSTTSTTQIYSGSGGNSAGHIQIRKDLSPPEFDIGSRTSSDPNFLGDYAAGAITGAGFDLNVFNTSLDSLWIRFRVDTSTNGWHYNFGGVVPNANAWEAHDVNFDPTWDDATALLNGWTQESGAGSFAATLGSVGWVEVRAINDGSAIVGLDNIRLLPTPGTGTLAALAMLGVARRRR